MIATLALLATLSAAPTQTNTATITASKQALGERYARALAVAEEAQTNLVATRHNLADSERLVQRLRTKLEEPVPCDCPRAPSPVPWIAAGAGVGALATAVVVVLMVRPWRGGGG